MPEQVRTGIAYPVNAETFQVNAGTKAEPRWIGMAGITNLNLETSGTVQSYFEMEHHGYESNYKTAISGSITTTALRYFGDEGSDLLFNTQWRLSPQANMDFRIIMPDRVIYFNAVVLVNNIGGATEDMITGEIEFRVNGEPDFEEGAIAGIGVSPSLLALTVGDTANLIATLYPETATGTVTWTTSNSEIATVNSNGVVRAIAAGSATITATIGTFTDTCSVTVSAAE